MRGSPGNTGSRPDPIWRYRLDAGLGVICLAALGVTGRESGRGANALKNSSATAV